MTHSANGYTGNVATRFAKDCYLSPIVAGRAAEHTGRVARTYITIPAGNGACSTSSVPCTENHTTRPSSGDCPGQSGRSRAWAT